MLYNPNMDFKKTVREGYNAIANRYLAERTRDSEDVRLLNDFIERLPADAKVLDAGCGATIVAPDEQALVEAVQRHMAEEHDSFELEDVIIDMSTEVDDDEQEER